MSISFRYLWQEARRGKSIARILMNTKLMGFTHELHGVVQDLGCGATPSYWRLMGVGTNERIKKVVGVDASVSCRPSVVADLAWPLPMKDKTADVVILGSVLMLLPDPEAHLKEVRRILKENGTVLLYTNFVWNHVPDPHDYWRFTEEGLALLLRRAGFGDLCILAFGGRWSAAVYLLAPFLRPKWLLAPVVYWVAIQLDEYTDRLARLPRHPIGYVVRARCI